MPYLFFLGFIFFHSRGRVRKGGRKGVSGGRSSNFTFSRAKKARARDVSTGSLARRGESKGALSLRAPSGCSPFLAQRVVQPLELRVPASRGSRQRQPRQRGAKRQLVLHVRRQPRPDLDTPVQQHGQLRSVGVQRHQLLASGAAPRHAARQNDLLLFRQDTSIRGQTNVDVSFLYSTAVLLEDSPTVALHERKRKRSFARRALKLVEYEVPVSRLPV